MKMLQKIEDRLGPAGINQGELEQLAGLAKGRFSKWKEGQGEPTARQAMRIARILMVPLTWLLDDEAADDPPQDGIVLTADERALIGVFRGSGLTLEKAAERLSKPTSPALRKRRSS